MNIELSELGRHEAWLRLSSIMKSGDDQIRLERKLASELIKNWRETYSEALKELFRQLPKEISQEAIEIITQRLSEALGQSFGGSPKVREEIRKYITKAYEKGKSEFALKPDLRLPDLRAINVLTKHNCYWLGEHYGKHIKTKIAELTQEALSNGLGRDELAEELRSVLGGEVGGYKYWDVAASAALVRSRSFGCISGMVEAGIAEYEILAMDDERTCPICGDLDGTVHQVSIAQAQIDEALKIDDPERFKEAFSWPPSPSEETPLPPFHGRCRCILSMTESTESFSGALNDYNDPNGDRREAHAQRYYETLRNSKSEPIVRKLSEHSGVSLKTAQKVYEHVFINQYELEDGIKKTFDPSYDMAQSIQRLLSGKGICEHDKILIHHERLEYELMHRYGKPYDEAHKLACRKYDYQAALLRWLQEGKANGTDRT